LGSAREVGRSAILMETKKSKVLLDYGVKLNEELSQLPLPVHGFVDSVVLSHAHLDHSGAIPYLFKATEPTVYATPSTIEVSKVLLEDSMKIADSRGQDCFTRSDYKRMLRNIELVPYHVETQVTDNISFSFSDAGHILGAAITRLHINDKKEIDMVYSGDFKDTDTRMHKGAKMPSKADVLIVESTYGDREHPDRKKLEKEFVEEIRSVIDVGGTVLLPCFAVGRTQEIVTLLYANRLECPVYMDGMGSAISEIYLEHAELLRDYEEFYHAMKWVNWITDRKQREKVFDEPSVIVSTAGMLTGGPAVGYIPELRTIKNAAIFFTGFQVPGTPGNRLLNEKVFDYEGFAMDFRGFNIKWFDFSAHTDKNGIHKFIKAVDPQLVLINHGEPEQSEALRKWVEEEIGCYVFTPTLREKFGLEDFV